jgi:hypothetical protein
VPGVLEGVDGQAEGEVQDDLLAGEPAASQGGSVTADAGNPAAPRCGAASPQGLNLSILDQVNPANGIAGLDPRAAALCPLQLHAGITPPGASPLDCQCSTDCIAVC